MKLLFRGESDSEATNATGLRKDLPFTISDLSFATGWHES